MDKTLSDLLDYRQSNNRVCPRPLFWEDLYKILPKNKMGVWPPAPKTLAAWWHTSAVLKQRRFLEHIQWAFDQGVLEKVGQYLRSISEDQWHYLNE